MKFRAEIDIMPLKALLDPQGKTVTQNMINMGLSDVNNVRIGKHVTLEVEATSKEEATEKIDLACKKILANPIMESYSYEIFNQA
ncbi:MAG: phosphoribosylformylglycinamidine synthase subunit PurS [Schleiferiaceae bacterium]|jgi:phosphoribosylformylglycinamidine synthase|nr:phosphoribosylformylglycinamidine synthase subunit PurS [Schleiferiaceae bacterium]MDG1881657.1 phosphoribosylformylglycinamidine synthase subunit PurS [Schleiferiaceae bacterium]|tara:strand:- start:1488 stop:1742 length:255 start_codon:yes stop_codon:yes gene_type:complete